MHASPLLALVGSAVLVSANTRIHGPIFNSDPDSVARAAAPQWHFDQKTCFPTHAGNGAGGPNPGLPPDNCNELKVNNNCPPQPKFAGQGTEAADFPTYWKLRYCAAVPGGRGPAWRLLYNLYFPKDTGHRHDWEWVIVNWEDDGSGGDMWKRTGMWFEHEGNHGYKAWGDIESTFNDPSDRDQTGQKGKDKAKLYVAKWHHSIWDTMQTSAFANTCPPSASDDYRPNDYRWEAGNHLVHATDDVINPNWDYGSADSTPPSFNAGGKYDICTQF